VSRALERLADLRHQDWRENAYCLTAPAGTEFVEIDAETAESLVYRYCHRCAVVGACREQYDAEAPHRFRTVAGGRVYEKGEAA
jgi:hypothetical protein